jgi:hypothetical protein
MRPLFACVIALALSDLAAAPIGYLTPRDRFRLAYDPRLATHGAYFIAYHWAHVPYLVIPKPGLMRYGPILFPPEPPALGAPMSTATPAGDPPPPPPTELASYLSDSFYAALSLHLTSPDPQQQPSAGQRALLDLYREDKAALQAELVATIDTLRDADAATRLRTLTDFAAQQTPRIARLEIVAEQLRHDLVPPDLRLNFESVATVNDLAAWPAGVLRAAAFLQDGLSSAQRRLLREAATESATKASGVTPGSAGPLFFAPEPARASLPANASATLSAHAAAYASEKSALKNELAAVLVTVDPAARSKALSALAEKQAPRFATLETAAESIRRDWAAESDPAQPPDLPQVPPELEARIVAYRREKLDLQKALLARVGDVQRSAAPNAAPVQVQEKIRRAIAAFTGENAARYAALDRSKDAIRSDLARLSSATASTANSSADVLLRRFSASMQQWETWRNYHYYQIAVLQPGLSPEQRRLLFDHALSRLALPSPEGILPSD